MHGIKKFTLFVGALLPFAFALPQALDTPPDPPEYSEWIPNKYIVTLKPTASDLGAHLSWVNSVHARSIGRRDLGLAGVEETYNITTFKGYAGAFDNATITEIAANPQVEAVEPDEYWVSFASITQKNVPSWGLSAISSLTGAHGKLSGGKFHYDDSAGRGTYAYILDEGINEKHVEFKGRIEKTYNVFKNRPNALPTADTDVTGHGTHVAGILAGTTYGVAKKAEIIAIKVFGEEQKDPDRAWWQRRKLVSTKSKALEGYVWAVNDIIRQNRQGKSVINLSLGHDYQPLRLPKEQREMYKNGWRQSSKSFDSAMTDAWNRGILSVVAAGNSGQLAKYGTPGNAEHAFTVGATNNKNELAWFSNWGSNVDILAPGQDITSAFIGSSTSKKVMSGTSMATPHVAGLALTLMSMAGPGGIPNPADVKNRIIDLSIKDLIPGLGIYPYPSWDMPNRFLSNIGA